MSLFLSGFYCLCFCLFVCFFVVVVFLCVRPHVHIYTMHSVDNIPGRGKKKLKNKNTFKEGVKFPQLECTVEIRTELSGTVLEPSGWLSLLCYAFFSKCVVLLMAYVGNFATRKTCENSTFFFFVLTSQKKTNSEGIDADLIFARCAIPQTPVIFS